LHKKATNCPAYMSPEQATRTAGIDGRADIYALGCVLYEMLAGAPPFTGATVQAILDQHATAPLPSLRVVRPDIPACAGGGGFACPSESACRPVCDGRRAGRSD
jgi:serine/threonine protein kinase